MADRLREFKFHRRAELDAILGRALGEVIRHAPWYDTLHAMVPVPTCWQRRWIKPSHATSELAPITAATANLPLERVLRRIKGGPSQVGLSAAQRIENVRGKFQVIRGIELDNLTLCLIDDVATTGATIHECAKMLRRAGATAVYAAIVTKAGGLHRGV